MVYTTPSLKIVREPARRQIGDGIKFRRAGTGFLMHNREFGSHHHMQPLLAGRDNKAAKV